MDNKINNSISCVDIGMSPHFCHYVYNTCIYEHIDYIFYSTNYTDTGRKEIKRSVS